MPARAPYPGESFQDYKNRTGRGSPRTAAGFLGRTQAATTMPAGHGTVLGRESARIQKRLFGDPTTMQVGLPGNSTAGITRFSRSRSSLPPGSMPKSGSPARLAKERYTEYLRARLSGADPSKINVRMGDKHKTNIESYLASGHAPASLTPEDAAATAEAVLQMFPEKRGLGIHIGGNVRKTAAGNYLSPTHEKIATRKRERRRAVERMAEELLTSGEASLPEDGALPFNDDRVATLARRRANRLGVAQTQGQARDLRAQGVPPAAAALLARGGGQDDMVSRSLLWGPQNAMRMQQMDMEQQRQQQLLGLEQDKLAAQRDRWASQADLDRERFAIESALGGLQMTPEQIQANPELYQRLTGKKPDQPFVPTATEEEELDAIIDIPFFNDERDLDRAKELIAQYGRQKRWSPEKIKRVQEEKVPSAWLGRLRPISKSINWVGDRLQGRPVGFGMDPREKLISGP